MGIRSLLSLCGVLCVGLVSAGSAAAGSALPDGTRYYKELGESQSITVQVGKGVSVTLFAVPIKCTKYIPLQGNKSYVEIGMSGPQHPRIGKSYLLKKTETQRDEEIESTSTTTTEVTLNFKSAKQVEVSIHQFGTTDGEAGCDGSASYTVKRQS
ncbi:MAG: hypothetical protein JST53_03320 [Actinobacteria bacterium]|nr:hypothetical protein [Actinomycetota bacterium]